MNANAAMEAGVNICILKTEVVCTAFLSARAYCQCDTQQVENVHPARPYLFCHLQRIWEPHDAAVWRVNCTTHPGELAKCPFPTSSRWLPSRLQRIPLPLSFRAIRRTSAKV